MSAVTKVLLNGFRYGTDPQRGATASGGFEAFEAYVLDPNEKGRGRRIMVATTDGHRFFTNSWKYLPGSVVEVTRAAENPELVGQRVTIEQPVVPYAGNFVVRDASGLLALVQGVKPLTPVYAPGGEVIVLHGARYLSRARSRLLSSNATAVVGQTTALVTQDEEGDWVHHSSSAVASYYTAERYLLPVPDEPVSTVESDPQTEAATGGDPEAQLRDLVRAFYAEGVRRGYDSAVEDFEGWFGQRAGVSLTDFAGQTYRVTGTYAASAAHGAQQREVTVYLPSVGLERRFLTDTDDPLGTIGMCTAVATLDATHAGMIAPRDYDMRFEKLSRPDAALPEGTAGGALLEEVLDWIGNRAEEDDWCSEYEAFCRKMGVEPRRPVTEYNVEMAVALTTSMDYSLSDISLDDAIRDVLPGEAMLDSFDLQVEYSMSVTIATAEPDDLTEEDVREALMQQGVPSQHDISSFYETDRERV